MAANPFRRARSRRGAPLCMALLVALSLLTSYPAAPVVAQASTSPYLQGQPIWAAGSAAPGSVALFRYRFTLGRAAAEARLAIFADTRYEAWLDGRWLGRGPARFSTLRQEYDLLPAGDLAAGSHVLAVLVQFAPNTRRSESLRPMLQASLHGLVGDQRLRLAATGTSWRAIVSPAWNEGARPVSDLGLIGPLELLDTRLLPAGWTETGFLGDVSWPAAQLLSPAPFTRFSPRSIALLAQTPRAPVALVESGLLSPGMRLLDFEAGEQPDELTLRVNARTTLQVEALDQAEVLLDGEPLGPWQPLDDPRRPDVLAASRALTAGSYRLGIAVPPQGRALLIGGPGVSLTSPPALQQGRDPGRRTLLLNPLPDPSGPQVELGAQGAEVTVTAGLTPRYLALDMGRTVYGRVEALAEGPAGTLVEIGWDERLRAGRPLPAPGSLHDGLWRLIDSWVLDGSPRRLSTLDARGGRYLYIQVFGDGPVSLRGLRVVEEHYPVSQLGRFRSSDERLNQIWQVGVDSALVNMSDAYADPWRERGQWVGDMLVIYHVNKVAFGDYALLRRALRQTAEAMGEDGRPAAFAPRPEAPPLLLDYGMHWVDLLHDYWRATGDLALVAELYEPALRLAGFLRRFEDEAGLISFPATARWYESALLDWSAGPARRGTSTGLNAQYAATLGQLAELSDALERPEGADLRARRDAVSEAINRELYEPARGYVSSRIDGVAQREVPISLAWTLHYGAVPESRRPAAAEALVAQLDPYRSVEPPNIEIFGSFWALEALARGERFPEALALIRSRYGRLLDQGATTWWERFDSDGSYNSGLSHGWGGAPTWFLSSYVLGARLPSPGNWEVQPHPLDLRWASGALPTVQGPLDVRWSRESCERFTLRIEAPEGTAGAATLPVRRADVQLRLNGQLIWDGGPLPAAPARLTDTGLRVTELGAGVHDLVLDATCATERLPIVMR